MTDIDKLVGEEAPLEVGQKINEVVERTNSNTTDLINKANDSDVVHTSGDETIDGTKTLTKPLKIQNGAGTGTLIIGADVNANTLNNKGRKLARVAVPTQEDNNLTSILLGFDSSGDSDLNITNKSSDNIAFGGSKKISNATSPMSISFCVATERNAKEASKKRYPLEMDAYEARFNVQPNYNGIDLATIDKITTYTAGDNVIIEDNVISAYSGKDLFDIVQKDHILSYEETEGYELLGNYVYKTAVAGSRYGYPDFYAKCLEEKTAGTATSVTLGENTVTMFINTNGHQFFDIADKEAIDAFYNATGTAWFYGVDEANERILLPRNDYYFKNGGADEVGKNIEAGLPNIEGKLGDVENTPMKLCNLPSGEDTLQQGALSIEIESTSWSAPANQAANTIRSLKFDASLSNSIYGNSETVQPASVSVLAYMVVGNVKTTQGYSEVVAQGKEILEQVNEGIANGIETRANLDLSNVTQSSGLRRLVEVSDSSLMPSWYKVFEETNPQTGEVKKWCEQGGISAVATATTTILLLKEFANTNYNLKMTGSAGYPFKPTKNLDSFVADTSAAATVDWEAKGYIN